MMINTKNFEGWLVVLVGLAVLLIAALLARAVIRWLRRTPPAASDDRNNLTVKISALNAGGPSLSGPRLEFYGTPVRLAVLVLAPAGRGVVMPKNDELPEVVEGLVPGLLQVLAADQPIFRRWPLQLSTQGFVQSFFHNLALPGDKGKKTPWCAAAGRFEAGDQQFLAGLVCCAAAPNSLSQVFVEHPGQWHEVLRVRPA